MSKSKLQVTGGFVHLVGKIDESFPAGELAKLPRPIKIDLSRVVAVNSLGVRELAVFARELRRRELEYHRCSPAFTDVLNAFPAVMGDPPDPAVVRSIGVVYRCGVCQRETIHVIDLKVAPGSMPELPDRRCGRCNQGVRPFLPSSDLLGFFDV